jgi:hypothetical protein
VSANCPPGTGTKVSSIYRDRTASGWPRVAVLLCCTDRTRWRLGGSAITPTTGCGEDSPQRYGVCHPRRDSYATWPALAGGGLGRCWAAGGALGDALLAAFFLFTENLLQCPGVLAQLCLFVLVFLVADQALLPYLLILDQYRWLGVGVGRARSFRPVTSPASAACSAGRRQALGGRCPGMPGRRRCRCVRRSWAAWLATFMRSPSR